ncbi:retropepsin-like aspartic protease [Chryseobacterium sp. RR2-3-20]|uniref:retropepsin-like aspartic protease n=1 Tax=Chryseobacterium sp. RR2-3-20 TaxID=2787626 RepID=UPI001ADED35E|nr:retropepsin-like aspartic protease [Chryseobacterium sp. RR2-3-20]
MKNILILFFFTFCFVLDKAQAPINLNTGNIAQKKYNQTLSYELVKKKIIVNVSINGKPHKFLFDTGAPMAVSKEIFDEYSLPKTGSIPLADASGKKQEMILTTVPSLKWGEIDFLNTPGIVFDESSTAMMKCFGVEGIIGSNMLRNSVVQIDHQKKQITITDNVKNLTITGNSYLDMKLSESQSNPFIRIVLQKDGVKVVDQVLFDTGADDFYEISTSAYHFFNEKNSVIKTLAKSKGSFVYGFHGMNDTIEQFAIEIPLMTIVEDKFNNVISSTTSSKESRLGYKVLEYGKTTLDYNKKRFYFEPYSDANKELIALHPWQIYPTIQNNKLVVGIIWDKSLEKNLNLGDEIQNFNDIDYKNMDVCELFRSNNSNSNNESVLTVKDVKTGEIKTLKIKRL